MFKRQFLKVRHRVRARFSTNYDTEFALGLKEIAVEQHAWLVWGDSGPSAFGRECGEADAKLRQPAAEQ